MSEYNDEKLAKYVYLATWVEKKGYDYEMFGYCDNAYDLSEEDKEAVWELRNELKEIGYKAFREKYSKFSMYY